MWKKTIVETTTVISFIVANSYWCIKNSMSDFKEVLWKKFEREQILVMDYA